MIRPILARTLLGFIIPSAICAGRAFAAPTDWGQPVLRIRLECDARLSLEDFPGEIVQKVGEPLDPTNVSESLKKLYATGRFRELRADVEPQPTGVELVFRGRAVFFAGVVQVEGAPGPLDPKLLVDASLLRLGQPIAAEELTEADKRLTRVLADNGYYEAQVKHHLKEDSSSQEAEITFSLVPAPPAKLDHVEFQGHPIFPPQRLAKVAGWHPGDHLTSHRVENGLFKIRKFFTEQDRLEATASVQKRVYDPKSQKETMLVKIEAGRQVHIQVEGARFSNSKLREILPIFREGVLDEDALTQGERNLEDYFERRGYFSVTAHAGRRESSDSKAVNITYRVNLGPPGVFGGYEFRGNRSLTTTELSAALSEEASGRSRLPLVFSRQLFAHYAEVLLAAYQSRGHLDARVNRRTLGPSDDRPSRLKAIFEIEEGLRTKVGHLDLQGVEQQTKNQLWPLLLTRVGQPYSPARAQTDRDTILGYLVDRGYTRANVFWQASPANPSHEVDLDFQIDRGPKEMVRRLIIMGNRHTRAGIIERELSVEQGEPLRQSDLLESQRRLYDLGIFNQVQITTQETQSPETERTVLVNVEEAKRWTVGYGGGIEVQRLGSNQPEGQLKASPRLSFDLTRLNVGGRAQIITLRGRLSNLEKGGGFSYLIPHFPTGHHLSLRLNGLVDRSRDVLTFTSRRREASVSLERRYSPATFVLGRFSFRRVDALDIRIRPELVPLASRSARVAMLGGSYINDHRDNPVDATAGSYSLADAGISWDKFGSQANFVRFSGQNATFYRLGRRLTFARNTRFQVESKFSSSKNDIPLPERLFMGGSESHRGFSINQAGPRDPETGFPIGGNALFFNSLELRIRVVENRLGLVLFHDGGNVYSTIQRMRVLKITQKSPSDFDYTVHAVGLGLRYRTPVGPVRFDVGYSLNPPRFQVKTTHGIEVRQLPQFQFFVSIGQSF